MRVSSPRIGIARVSVIYSLSLNTGNRCCSPSLNVPPSAIMRTPSISCLSVTVKRKLTGTVFPASTVKDWRCVEITLSVIGSKSTNFVIPFRAFPVRLVIVAAILVLSPTRTKRGILGDNMNSFTVTVEASNFPIIIPFV